MFLPLGFGIAFQLPLLMLLMNRLGIITVGTYLSKWRIAIMIIFVVAMVLTPADPISMLLMAFPLTFLYFVGIGLCQWMPGRRINPFGGHSAAGSLRSSSRIFQRLRDGPVKYFFIESNQGDNQCFCSCFGQFAE
jgi:hypothetical protein